MKSVEPYLIFNGNCEEAFSFYSNVIGVEIAFISRYRDIPAQDDISEEDMDKIVHILLPVSKQVMLMGADSPGNLENSKGNNIFLTLNAETEEEARRLYEKLTEGGQIIMPLGKTFWAELYAMLTDKFGIHWMINYGPMDSK